MTRPMLFIDAGHGGEDAGVTHTPAGRAVRECDLTLTMALRLREAVLALGWADVAVSRDADVDMSLSARGQAAQASGARLAISLHVNSSPDPAVKGLMTFCWPGNESGLAVGRAISRAAPYSLYRRDAKCYEATDLPGPSDDWLRRARAVLSKYPMTAVLVEMGHMTNDYDRASLQNEWVQQQLVASLLTGVALIY